MSLDLRSMPVGAVAIVDELNNPTSMRRRLMDIGLTRGTAVRCLYRNPSGDPAAYLIRGAVIALRGEDARQVKVLS